MANYKVDTPRSKYTVEADNKADARKVVFERENIEMDKIDDVPDVKPLNIIDYRHELPFERSLGENNKSRINKAVIHHDGQYRPDVYSSHARYTAQANYHISKGYGHISYHYIIDNVGDVFQCLDVDERAYHAGHWLTNLTSIAIKFDGNMDTQKLTEAQKLAYKQLMVHLTTERPDMPNLVRGSEKGHRDVKSTACPGAATTDKFIHNY